MCRTDVRGTRKQLQFPQPTTNIVEVDNDNNYGGVQPIILETEPDIAPATMADTYVASASENVPEDADELQQ